MFNSLKSPRNWETLGRLTPAYPGSDTQSTRPWLSPREPSSSHFSKCYRGLSLLSEESQIMGKNSMYWNWCPTLWHLIFLSLKNISEIFSWLIFMIFSPPGPLSLHQNGLCAQSAVKFKFGSGTFLSLNGWVAIAEPTGNTENDCVSGVAQVRAPWWCSRDQAWHIRTDPRGSWFNDHQPAPEPVAGQLQEPGGGGGRHDRVQGRLGSQASTTAPFWPETKHYVTLHHLHYSSHHISSIKKIRHTCLNLFNKQLLLKHR